MYTIEEVKQQLIKSDPTQFTKDFVASAVAIDNSGNAYHAGLVINFNNKSYLFHYTGEEVVLELLQIEVDSLLAHNNNWYVHKVLDIILDDEIIAFLIHCQAVKKEAKPTYGYFYSGSFYDENGKYSSDKIPEIMTCVGFCLNVILGFIESEEYISYKDWNTGGIKEGYFEKYIKDFKLKYPELNIDNLKENLRRIFPSEYISSAYITDLPIRKAEVNNIIDYVTKGLQLIKQTV